MKGIDLNTALANTSGLREQVVILLEEAAFRANAFLTESRYHELCGEAWDRASRASEMPNAFPKPVEDLIKKL